MPPRPVRPAPPQAREPREPQEPREPREPQRLVDQPPPALRRARSADDGLGLFDEPPPPRRGRGLPADESPTEIIHFVDDDDFDEDYLDDYVEDERAEPEYIEPAEGLEAPPKPRRRALKWVAALAVIALIGGGAWFGIEKIFGYDDYEGAGESDVVIQIGDGDSTNAIGTELVNAGVVASAKAFVKASENNAKVLGLQPGYYVLKTKMSGAAAVAKLTGNDSRVGELQVRAGTQLDDVTQPDGSVTPGVLTLLSKASCATLNGKSTCVSVDDLRKAAQSADLTAMGVPDWAASVASKNPDVRRIEGLVAPGVYDVRPGWDANQVLGFVLRSSATKVQAAGLAASSSVQGQTPYQVLIIASLIEREGVQQDFEKISRVIYNRLAKNTRLQLDSTVNYLLDKPVVTTTDEDRGRPGPYNTYSVNGLPPTPISSPSPEAIQAALRPADGDWVFFVKCEKNGLSCFAVTPAEHNHNKEVARQNGAY